MQLEVEECSERTAGAISGNQRAADRGFGLTGRRQAGGHSREVVQRLKGSDAGGYRCGEKPGWSTGSRLHTPPQERETRGSPRANAATALSEGGGAGDSTAGSAPLTPELHQSRKWTLGPPPIRSEGRGMRPEVLLWCCSLHTET